VPLSGKEFKGVIYHNDQAVPILDWEFLTGRKISRENIVIIEYNGDLLGMEIGELAKVEEHPGKDLNGDEGFWIDMEPENGLYALNAAKLFQALRKGA
jgi:chemotaxis signal transduction protein